MGIKIKEKSDDCLEDVAASLRRFEEDHPGADIVLYRYNPASIRVRIISTKFQGMNLDDRHEYALKYLDSLDEETFNDISVLLCLVPGEHSMMDLEFENPSTSML